MVQSDYVVTKPGFAGICFYFIYLYLLNLITQSSVPVKVTTYLCNGKQLML